MDNLDIALLIVFILIFAWLIFALVIFSIYRKGFECEYKGHNIVFKLGFGRAFLLVDGKECDRENTAFAFHLTLKTQIEDDEIELRYSAGIFKPNFKIFVGDNELQMTRRKKVKKNANK